MYIKEIYLENFSNIKTGLNQNYLHIDFSDRQHRICVLKGANGKGKTSLLSYLTPFATLGNLDVRDRHSLILKDKVGKKRITIIDNDGNTLEIYHVYTPVKDKNHTIKSYISLNGEELNTNGNTSSFKELVKTHLGLDMDYLKLLRLGDNVNNLIKQLSTERKNFMSKILDDVNVWLKLYNKVNGDARDLKNIISHLVDKVNKLDISDIDKYLTEIEEMTDNLNKMINTLNEYNNDKAIISDRIEQLGDISEIKKELRAIKNKLNKFDGRDNIESVDEIDKKLLDYNKKQGFLMAEITSLEDKYNSTIKNLDTIINDLNRFTNELSNETSLELINNLESALSEMRSKLDDIIKNLDGIEINITKEEYDNFVVSIKNNQKLLNMTYEFGKEPIREAIKLISDNTNIDEYMVKGYLLNEPNDEKSYLDKLIDKYKNVTVPCDNDCILKELLSDLLLPLQIKRGPGDIKKDREYYDAVKTCFNNISHVLSDLDRMHGVIDKLPDKIKSRFTTKKILSNISDCGYIYKENDINDFMAYITENANRIKLVDEINMTKVKLDIVKSTSKVYMLQEEISRLEKEKEMSEETISDIKDTLSSKKDELASLDELINLYNDLRVVSLSRDEMLSSKKEYEEILSSYDEYTIKYDELNTNINMIQKHIDVLSKTISDMKYKATQYESNISDLSKLKKKYADINMLKKAYSTKSGIPLDHIKLYLTDTRQLANEMLDIVYDGDIQLEEFELTENEFNIPFYNKGIIISDIRYASQGESSFLSIAISFALSYQNLTDYNIPLLDEADSNLDASNRMKFINVIEHFMDIISCEQLFIITHNDMFSQYPVDVIDFDKLTFNDNKISTKIYKKESEEI